SRPGVVERLVVARLGRRGDGIAESVDGPIYVPGTLPGETVEVEAVPGQPDRRRLLKVEKSSARRIAPICRHFGICGGCGLQHLGGGNYPAWKRSLVSAARFQAGVETERDELSEAHRARRRRGAFHAPGGRPDGC